MRQRGKRGSLTNESKDPTLYYYSSNSNILILTKSLNPLLTNDVTRKNDKVQITNDCLQ